MSGSLFDGPRYAVGLNARQREAVEHDDGALIVLAGPGTGKTRVIVHRVARLLEVGGGGTSSGPVEPECVLAVTFTVKASAEMRSRLHALVGGGGGPAERVHVRTFHGFGRSLLRRFGDVIGLRPAWRIMDSAERTRLMRQVVADERLLADADAALGPDAFVADALEFIEQCRHQGVTPGECVREARRRVDEAGRGSGEAGGEGAAAVALADRFARRARAFEAFSKRCVRAGTLTFDDLIALATDLLADPRVGPIVRQDIRHVVVDEFQDINPAQLRMLRLLAPPDTKGHGSGPDLCVVGDDDQAIYAFRGASERSFEHFRAVWGGRGERPVRTVALEENYRSDPAILRAAGTLIGTAASRFAPDKALVAARPAAPAGPAGTTTPVVEGVILTDDDESADVIAAIIDHARRGGGGGSDADPGSFAVIARIHLHLARIAEQLDHLGIPFRYADRPGDRADAGVRDLLAWIEALIDPAGVGPVQRLLSRPPLGVPVQSLSSILRHELATRSRSRAFAEEHGAGSSAPAGHADPLSWLERAGADSGLDPGVAQTIARYIALHRSLARVAVASPAHEVIRRIIGDASLAESDGLDGRARARRVSALIGFLQFARSRADRFDPPGRLAELWSYYNDLSKNEQDALCGGASDDVIDAEDVPPGEEPAEGAAPKGAVTLLSGHGAKGLEFDNVIVAQVRPGGFPAKRGEADEPLLPRDWLDRLAAADGVPNLDRELAREDEQRRLFYVACTRARSRLVLLAKHKKTRGDATDYFIELEDAAGDIPMRVRTAAEVLDEACTLADSDSALREAGDAMARAVEAGEGSVGARLGARSRERARRALEQLVGEMQSPAHGSGADAGAMLKLAERVREEALRLAVTAGLAQSGEVPAWALAPSAGESVAGFAAALAQRVLARDDGRGPATTPFAAPLKLSYTNIRAYTDCPRCFYLAQRFSLREAADANMSLGSAAHEALHRYYTEVREADAEGRPIAGVERLVELARGALDQAWPRSLEMPAEVWTQLRAQMRTLHARLHDPAAHTLHLEELVKFPYEHRGVHEITAKLDRIDLAADGRYRIIDYKTGGPTKSKLEPDKADLQLGIYAMALRALQKDDGVAGTAEYWVLSTGQIGSIDLGAIKLDSVRKKINKAIDGMLEGNFEPDSGCKKGCGDFSLE